MEDFSGGGGGALEALQAGEPQEAATQFDRLTSTARKQRRRVLEAPSAAWEALKQLLDKRGYFFSTSEQISNSLSEIREVGEGFDLYDLGVAMARYDQTIVGCLGLGAALAFPPLRPFAPPCGCGRHGAEGESA